MVGKKNETAIVVIEVVLIEQFRKQVIAAAVELGLE